MKYEEVDDNVWDELEKSFMTSRENSFMLLCEKEMEAKTKEKAEEMKQKENELEVEIGTEQEREKEKGRKEEERITTDGGDSKDSIRYDNHNVLTWIGGWRT